MSKQSVEEEERPTLTMRGEFMGASILHRSFETPQCVSHCTSATHSLS